MKRTSIEAYKAIEKSGRLKGLQRAVLWTISFFKNPMTQREIYSAIDDDKVDDLRCVTPRFAELKRLGYIEENGKRKCNVSGRRCQTWSLTGNIKPKKVKVFSDRNRMDFIEKEMGISRKYIDSLLKDDLK